MTQKYDGEQQDRCEAKYSTMDGRSSAQPPSTITASSGCNSRSARKAA
jgi:hypothetical protein